MAERKSRTRLSKAALFRMKVATVVVSVVGFAGTMGAIAYAHPAVANHANTAAQYGAAAKSGVSGQTGSQLSNSPLQLPALAQNFSAMPLTRTRGS